MLTFCSSVSGPSAAAAAVLGESLLRHHPGARLAASLPALDLSRRPAGWAEMPVDDEATAPELLAHALREAELAVYVAPHLQVYDSLEPALALARAHGAAVVPRVGSLPDDGERPDEGDLLRAGRISAAFVAVARGEPGEAFLEWWRRRLEEDGASPGRWLELAVERFEGVRSVADPGCNVSYWNLHERPLERRDGALLTGGSRLRFIDFDGFRADRPYWLSEHATRVRVIADPILSELCGEYAAQLREAGWAPPRREIAGVDRLGNGQRVDHLVRALWGEALAAGRDFGDPLNPAAADGFVAWMREPAALGGASGVNRYLLAAYDTRPDLQAAFPHLDGDDGERLIEWAHVHGRREVLAELLPSRNGEATTVPGEHIAVNVIGYLGETLGLAEAARLYIEGLVAAGVPVTTTAVTPDLPVEADARAITRYGSREYEDLRGAANPVFNFACLNADHLQQLIRTRGRRILQDRPTIGQWAWETDVLPPSWSGAFDLVDEVWVNSRFVAEKLGRLVPVPVVVVPQALVVPDPGDTPPAVADDGRFTFLFMLDFFSTLRRKNPDGLIRAFTRAFEPGEGPRLVIKTINARHRPEEADALRMAAYGRDDIEFLDTYLEPAQKAALIRRADCYVSLHRSEGFGITLAEAMALGTPVIATGYSGNTDFTRPHNSYLVDYALTHVGSDCEIYPANGTWAEPDLDDAARLMRRVVERPEEAAARARRARVDIEAAYAPAVVGAIARGRLEQLADWGTTRASVASGDGAPLEEVERALAFDLRRGVGSGGRSVGGLVRQTILRLILPYSFHERQVDRAMLGALRDLRAELDAERERVADSSRRLGRIERAVERQGRRTPDAS